MRLTFRSRWLPAGSNTHCLEVMRMVGVEVGHDVVLCTPHIPLTLVKACVGTWPSVGTTDWTHGEEIFSHTNTVCPGLSLGIRKSKEDRVSALAVTIQWQYPCSYNWEDTDSIWYQQYEDLSETLYSSGIFQAT